MRRRARRQLRHSSLIVMRTLVVVHLGLAVVFGVPGANSTPFYDESGAGWLPMAGWAVMSAVVVAGCGAAVAANDRLAPWWVALGGRLGLASAAIVHLSFSASLLDRSLHNGLGGPTAWAGVVVWAGYVALVAQLLAAPLYQADEAPT